MIATVRVDAAGPLTTIQDRGRFGWQRYGVTEAGPMDPDAFQFGQRLLGTWPTGTAIEATLGGLELSVAAAERPLQVAVTGGDFRVSVDGERRSGWTILALAAGSRLSLRPGPTGSWAYVAFGGEIEVVPWLGSRATHIASGESGRALLPGDLLTIAGTATASPPVGDLMVPDFVTAAGPIRAVRGPQDDYFTAATIAALFGSEFRVSADYDRMGMRLDGPHLPVAAALTMPSEAILRGSVQIAGHGSPTILMADHGTAGGYPKIATVISADFGRVAQLRVGGGLRFAEVTAAEAVRLARARVDQMAAAVAAAGVPASSLTERLLSSNLVSGVVEGSET